MSRRAFVVGLALAATPALAQDVTPPSLVAPPAPVWPEDEPPRDGAVVIVFVDVDAEGRVTAVEVEAGVSPGLDAAAAEAARALRFSPARRGGEPVPARVRLRIAFTPPAIPEPARGTIDGTVRDATTRRPVAGARVEAVDRGRSALTDEEGAFLLELEEGPVELRIEARGYRPFGAQETVTGDEEIVVRYGIMPLAAPVYETVVLAPEREEVARRTLEREEVVRTPGTMGDPFRVIETLPGVTPLITGLPYYYIRGAPPADTGYFVDGVRVPALFHLALGPSVIHPFLVERVDFWAGGAPARFPGFVGGIVSASTAPLPTDRPHLDVDVRFVDAGGMVAAPLGDGSTRVSLSGRYSYTAALLTAVSPGAILDYWDYQIRVEHDLSARSTATLFAFGSYDFVGSEENGVRESGFSQSFHRILGSYGWDLGSDRRLDVGLALGTERALLGEAFTVDEYTLSPRAAYRWPVDRAVELTLGGEATYAYADLSLSDESEEEMDEEERDAFDRLFGDSHLVEAGAFGELRIQATPDLTLLPGARAWGLFTENRALPAFDPRFAYRQLLVTDVTLKGSVGLYHQRPAFVIPLPGLDSLDLARGLQRATQVSQGAEWAVPVLELDLDAQLFFHRYENLSDIDFEGGDAGSDDGQPRLAGNAYGLEVILRRRLGERFFGWIAYTLSRNERHFRSIERYTRCPTDIVEPGEPSDGLQLVPGATVVTEVDRTHVLNLVASYRLPGDFRVGARAQYRSGRPYTRYRCEANGGQVYDTRNGERTPGYFQLDLRIDKRWRYSAWDLELYFEFINVTFSAEVLAQLQQVQRDGSYGPPVTDLAVPIVIPTLGVRGVF